MQKLNTKRRLFISLIILAVMLSSSISVATKLPYNTIYAQNVTSNHNLNNYSVSSNNNKSDLSGANLTHIGDIIPNQYIVTLKDNATINEQQANSTISALSDESSANGVQVLAELPSAGVVIIKTPPNSISALADVTGDPNVADVEQDKVVGISSQTVPTGVQRIGAEPLTGAGSTITNTTTTTTQNQLVQAAPSTVKPVNATIGIIDTGMDLNQPDLNVVKQISFVPGVITGNDDNGHGTHVAGIAAAKDNNIGVVGVAPGAKLWAIKVLDSTGSGSTSSVLAGIDYAIKNAKLIDVINLSLEGALSDAENTAIKRAVQAGLTVVVAAGNHQTDASSTSPASAAEAITVSALADSDGKCGGMGPATSRGPDDSFATFSNYGKVVDIMAPGVDILSYWKNGGFNTISGTSMASPHVAGAAALYKSVHHFATAEQVLAALDNLASTPTTICNGDGHGYLVDRSADLDNVAEPLLHTTHLIDHP
jgi:subtilisin